MTTLPLHFRKGHLFLETEVVCGSLTQGRPRVSDPTSCSKVSVSD